MNDDFNLLFDLSKLKPENEFTLNQVNRKIKNHINEINKSKNKYNNFCLKSFIYLKGENCINDFKEPLQNEHYILNSFVILFKTFDDQQIKNVIGFMKNSILLSLYFNQYKYLFNLLSYDEVKYILENEIAKDEFHKLQKEAEQLTNKFAIKIMNNESIMDNKNELRELQKYYIYYMYNDLNAPIDKKKDFIKYYQIINFLRDFDFCLKINININFSKLNNKNHNFYNDLVDSLFSCGDDSISNFYLNLTDIEKKIEDLNEGYKMVINKSLTQKDFLIIENENIKEKIQSIEKELKAESIKYLKIEEIKNYIIEKNEHDKITIK